MSKSVLHVNQVSKSFGENDALKEIDVVVEPGEFAVLLGAAGAGKTTTLRVAAGLEIPDKGQVIINGEDATVKEPKDRDIAMIFDSLALYPNKTGFENMAHPLRMRKVPKDEMEKKINKIAEVLHIPHVLGRLPKTMSGGERQRVALGRALVRDPVFFMLDEPLSSLDAKLRVELRAELKRLQREHNYAFLYATPDYTEALAIADKVIMLVKGEVRQVAPPQDLYDNPADVDVARFLGAPEINLLDAVYKPQDQRLHVAEFEFPVEEETLGALEGFSGEIIVGLRPEHLDISPVPDGGGNGEVIDFEALGVYCALTVKVGEELLRVTILTAQIENFPIGCSVNIRPNRAKIMLFDRNSGSRLS